MDHPQSAFSHLSPILRRSSESYDLKNFLILPLHFLPMKVAITGGSGHIGANLIRELLKGPFQVRALTHLTHRAFEGLDIERIPGDLGDPESLEKLCRDCDTVFHLAAQISIGKHSMKELLRVNVDGTRNMVEACKKMGVRRLVHFSSVHALSQYPLDQPLTEENQMNLESNIPYERTKAISEHLVRNSAIENGLEIVVINPTAVIGPNDFRPSFLGQFLLRLQRGQIPGMVRGGYNFVDARDVARGAVKAAIKGRADEGYLLSGHYVDLPRLVDIIGEVLDRKIRLPMLSDPVAQIGVPFIQGWSWLKKEDPLYTSESLKILKYSNTQVSYEKAEKELSYQPRPLIETLSDTYSWFQQQKYL